MLIKRMAICYDFDKTLACDDMQSFTFIPSVGMSIDDFWEESDFMAQSGGMDKNLSWMKMMLDKASASGLPLSRSAFQKLGEKVKLYQGVDTWFELINSYALSQGIQMEHYIISSGLKELIEGSIVAPHIKRIYASTFYYSPDDVAIWPAQAINYTNKTQYLFRIAKGAFEENDERVNDSIPEEELYLPYRNMIYIGDSETDIPCMNLLKKKGGTSIGVYDTHKGCPKKVHQLFKEGRINYFAPADYRKEQPLFNLIIKLVDLVKARESLNGETEKLQALVNQA
ncbi:MAG: haloacid dehalogenase-like hydrolase [Clostridiales bacterium]|nr:haloacid dehalogenase-like hydrolase [Clostridiales bacterium]